ncbi:MAG: PTS transporter subunit EIIC [Lachnospiraceae bacterium]|nr:PTS transporter subunit EIIC [Lachnospiraceae bacterium]
MAKKDYNKMSEQLLKLIGGQDNVTQFTHCVTRLRLTVKDKSLVQMDQLKQVQGVIGTQWLGEQLQIIVGTEVEDIYMSMCHIGGFTAMAAVDENLDQDITGKEKFSLKNLGNNILAYLSPAMTGIIPMMMAACLCKTIGVILGPDMLNIISATGDIYILLDFMYDAFFYFIPLFLGYSAAKTLGMNPIYGIYLGALIMAPDFMALVGVRDTFSVFGIPAPVADYSSSFLPVILGVWIMKYVQKLWNKVFPEVLKTVFVPLCTILVMAPVMFVVCAPLGTYIGNVIGDFFITLSQTNIVVRTIASIALAVLLPYMVLGGMHGALVNFAILTFTNNGYETFILPIMLAYNFAVFGVALGAIIKLKKPANKSAVTGYFVSGILGSVTEPCLYGVIMKYRQTMKALLAASVVVGLIVGIFQPVYYVMTSATIFTFWVPWVAGGTANLIAGLALMILAFVSGTIAACFVKYDEEEA